MEDPTRNYRIPSSDVAMQRDISQGMNGSQSRTHLVDVNSRGSVFKKRDFYKNTTILLVFFTILLLLGLIIVSMYYANAIKALNRGMNICTSEECLHSAANLKLSMDETVDPCENFYKFTCGRWGEEHPNHGWYPKFSIFELIDEKVSIAMLNFLKTNKSDDEPLPVQQSRDLFQSCLDVEAQDELGYSVIYKYLKEVGLPNVPNFFKGETDIKLDWIKIAGRVQQIFAMSLFVQFDIIPDLYNRSYFIFFIGSGMPSTLLPSPFKKGKRNKYKDFVLNRKGQVDDDEGDEDDEELEEIAKNVMREIVKVVIENVTTTTPDEVILDKAVNILFNVTTDLAEINGVNITIDDYFNMENITVDDLQKLTDKYLVSENAKPFEFWKIYITHLFDGIGNVSFDFKNDLLYYAKPDMEYFEKMMHFLAKTPNLIIELYCWFTVVSQMILSTTTDISQFIAMETSENEESDDIAVSSSIMCSDLVNVYMPIAVSYGIADKQFTTITLPKVQRMIEEIKGAFIHRIHKMKWMDGSTRTAALEKAKNMVAFVGFPDWLMNKTAVEKYYYNITITPTTYLENLMQFIKAITPDAIQHFKDVNKKQWRTFPTTVNAYHYPRDNSINVPMAILTFPMYHLGLEALNYGTFGIVLGHELTHGFDNLGYQFDKDGNYKEWWTDKTYSTFVEKTKCFVKQYSNFHFDSIDMNVDGELTLGENIADNGAVHHAYLAYQNFIRKFGEEMHLPGFETYSNEQLFFIAFGSLWCETRSDELLADQIETDDHCPSEYRVIGSLQNSEEFSRIFKCKKGSRMNPGNKCKLW